MPNGTRANDANESYRPTENKQSKTQEEYANMQIYVLNRNVEQVFQGKIV